MCEKGELGFESLCAHWWLVGTSFVGPVKDGQT